MRLCFKRIGRSTVCSENGVEEGRMREAENGDWRMDWRQTMSVVEGRRHAGCRGGEDRTLDELYKNSRWTRRQYERVDSERTQQSPSSPCLIWA